MSSFVFLSIYYYIFLFLGWVSIMCVHDHSVICLWRSEDNTQELVLFFHHRFQGSNSCHWPVQKVILSLSYLASPMFFLYRNFTKSVLCFLHLSKIFIIGSITLLDSHRSRGYSVWFATSRSIYRSAYILAQQSFFPHEYPNSS